MENINIFQEIWNEIIENKKLLSDNIKLIDLYHIFIIKIAKMNNDESLSFDEKLILAVENFNDHEPIRTWEYSALKDSFSYFKYFETFLKVYKYQPKYPDDYDFGSTSGSNGFSYQEFTIEKLDGRVKHNDNIILQINKAIESLKSKGLLNNEKTSKHSGDP